CRRLLPGDGRRPGRCRLRWCRRLLPGGGGRAGGCRRLLAGRRGRAPGDGRRPGRCRRLLAGCRGRRRARGRLLAGCRGWGRRLLGRGWGGRRLGAGGPGGLDAVPGEERIALRAELLAVRVVVTALAANDHAASSFSSLCASTPCGRPRSPLTTPLRRGAGR